MEERGSTVLNQVKFTWIISEARNIFNLKTGDCIYSPPIADGKKLKWIIKLYPNGMNETCKDHISICIGLREKLSTAYSTIKLYYKFYFLNNQNELLEVNIRNSRFSNLIASKNNPSAVLFGEAFTTGWPKYLPKIKLQNNLNNFINENGDLKLYCEIIKESKISNLESIIKQPFNDEELICFKCSDFEKVLNNETFSDIKLIVGNVIFSAHKVILAAKSPVFMTIMERSLTVQTIEINDINASVIKEMLRYMYIGSVENIQDIAIDLLAAASKYQMHSLMKLCQNNLIKNMSLTNAIDLLLAAEAHDAKNLKSAAIKIISANIKVLRKSENWSKLNFKLVTEILDVLVN